MGTTQLFGDPDRRPPEDPFPGRHDAHTTRLANAEQARRIAASQRLAGSHDESARTRTFLTEEFDPVVRRDAVGRLVVDWNQAGAQPHDSAGRFTSWPEARQPSSAQPNSV